MTADRAVDLDGLREAAEKATVCGLCDGSGRRVIPRGGAFDCPDCDGTGWENGFAATPATVLALLGRMDAVRKLHRPLDTEDGPWCHQCAYAYPCPTVRALDGEEQ